MAMGPSFFINMSLLTLIPLKVNTKQISLKQHSVLFINRLYFLEVINLQKNKQIVQSIHISPLTQLSLLLTFYNSIIHLLQ